MPRESTIAAHLAPTLCALTLGAALAACGPAPVAAPEPSAKATAPQPGNPGSSTKAHDFATLDICSLVSVTEVAEVLGHDPASGSTEKTMGRHAADCTYSFDRGDGSSGYAMIWAYPAQLWAPEEKGEIEEVSGLGDAAFLSSIGSFAQMNVLLEGELYLDARADTPERARALAERAMAGLDPVGSGITSP